MQVYFVKKNPPILIPYKIASSGDPTRIIAENTIYIFLFKTSHVSFQIPLKGVLRGIGQQAFGAVVNVMACLLIGLPVAVSVMFETYIGVIGMLHICYFAGSYVEYF